jgi:hypothetical protein
MAGNDDRKAELRAELERARSRASAYRGQMQARPSVTSKAQKTISRNRVPWLVGALLVGLVVAKLPPRTKKVPVNRWTGKKVDQPSLEQAGKAGFFLALLKIGIDVTKPVLMAWATKRLGEMIHVQKKVERKVEKVDRKV